LLGGAVRFLFQELGQLNVVDIIRIPFSAVWRLCRAGTRPWKVTVRRTTTISARISGSEKNFCFQARSLRRYNQTGTRAAAKRSHADIRTGNPRKTRFSGIKTARKSPPISENRYWFKTGSSLGKSDRSPRPRPEQQVKREKSCQKSVIAEKNTNKHIPHKKSYQKQR
jgi:hypothetical protein